MTITKMRQRGQITLPVEVRRQSGIKENSPLSLSVLGEAIVITKYRTSALSELQEKAKQRAKGGNITLDKILKEIKQERRRFNRQEYGTTL